MKETVNQEQSNRAAEQPERTFTQSEMNAIIGERLNREREKYADYEVLKDKAQRFDANEESAKTDLQRATERANDLQEELDKMRAAETVRTIHAQVSQETGVPMNLLTGSSKDICREQAEAILAFARTAAGYPQVKDSGEIHHAPSGKTRDQFADWFNETLK